MQPLNNRPLVYLAGPYSHPNPEVREARFNALNQAAKKLTEEGHVVFSPITHSHPLHLIGLDGAWDFWARIDAVYLSLCHKMFVFMLPGWETSVGVTAEIQIANEMGIEIEYMNETKTNSPEKPVMTSPHAGVGYLAGIVGTNNKGVGPEGGNCKNENVGVGPEGGHCTPDDQKPLKDSGERILFSGGAVRDTTRGKGRYDLLSPYAIFRLSRVFEKGAEKYDARNWEKGMSVSRLMDSGIRHAFQYLEGNREEDHLAQAAWNLMAAIHMEEMIRRGVVSKEFDDLPNHMEKPRE